jgi:hypothetical protein
MVNALVRWMHKSLLKEGNTTLTQITSTNTIVHPRTMVVHPRNASIANSTMMRSWRLEGLTLSTHTMRCLRLSLRFARDRSSRDRSWVRQGGFGMGGQRQNAQDTISHTSNGWNALSDSQKHNSHTWIKHEQPYKCSHDSSGLIRWIHPSPIFFPGTKTARPRIVVEWINIHLSSLPCTRSGLGPALLSDIIRVIVI